jgi:predicted adenylyl cyclase CyaB
LINAQGTYRIRDDAARARLQAALEERRFEFQETVTTDDTYYRGPGLSPGHLLRWRHEHGGADDYSDNLTWIGDRVDAHGLREPMKIDVMTEAEVHSILTRVGFHVDVQVRKDEVRYRRDTLVASLSFVEGLGRFLELQAAQDAATLAHPEQRILEEARLLGLDAKDLVPETYLDLLRRRL